MSAELGWIRRTTTMKTAHIIREKLTSSLNVVRRLLSELNAKYCLLFRMKRTNLISCQLERCWRVRYYLWQADSYLHLMLSKKISALRFISSCMSNDVTVSSDTVLVEKTYALPCHAVPLTCHLSLFILCLVVCRAACWTSGMFPSYAVWNDRQETSPRIYLQINLLSAVYTWGPSSAACLLLDSLAQCPAARSVGPIWRSVGKKSNTGN